MSTLQSDEATGDRAATEQVDVLIIGAGLSGIGAAAHLASELPGTSYAVLERREAIGGTWDLFRYPGVRSDSDMHTLGYRFRPWPSDDVLADGPSIRDYVRATAEEHGVSDSIRFRHQVTGASWDSGRGLWTVEYRTPDGPGSIRARFLWCCSGYYDYEQGHDAGFEGVEDFAGQVVHPQFWPDDLEYAGKKVVVIGSGATAVTLVPAMAEDAAHVTMLQRSPSYILSIPSHDGLGPLLRKVLPERAAGEVTRWRNVLVQAALFQVCRRRPALMRKVIRSATLKQLPEGYDVDKHFGPSYDPWDQRMCMVPNGDLFKAIRRGRASVVTDRIERFTERGLLLAGGEELEADIVVTATGLRLQMLGGASLEVDGEPVELHEHFVYRGSMLDGVPNFWFVVGYTNASWTLKADLVSASVIRVLKRMLARGERVVVPERPEEMGTAPLLNLDSGYINRALGELPRAGDRGEWQMPNNYLLDVVRLGRARPGGALRFS